MEISLIKSGKRKLLVIIGIPGALLVTGVFLLLQLTTPNLTVEEAQKRVRLYLQRVASQRHMQTLKENNLKLPTDEMAKQWKQEIDRINSIEFAETKVKRPIPDILFEQATPAYVVKVVYSDNSTHYFWISFEGIDREISKFMWLISF